MLPYKIAFIYTSRMVFIDKTFDLFLYICKMTVYGGVKVDLLILMFLLGW